MSIVPVDIAAAQADATRKDERIPEPCIVVIFGASGDLTKRKLLPALYHLEQAGLLPEDFAVVGVARRDLSATFGPDMQDGIIKGGGVEDNDPKLKPFMDRVYYFATEFDDDAGFEKLKAHLADLDGKFNTKGNRLFYLAVAPEFFADITHRLGQHGMAKPEPGDEHWVRVIIEKPFGTDLESARKLNDEINSVLSEDQIFRIDHYLGKETVQNILVFRFGNGIFEPVWNRNYIDHVEITAAESIGIEGRGPFYEKAGAVRDVLQNHVMEVLSFVAMEPPDSFQADAVRTEKLKVWRAIERIPVENTVRGQYGPGEVGGKIVAGYREEDRVPPPPAPRPSRPSASKSKTGAGLAFRSISAPVSVSPSASPRSPSSSNSRLCTSSSPTAATTSRAERHHHAHPARRRNLPPFRRQGSRSDYDPRAGRHGFQLRGRLR